MAPKHPKGSKPPASAEKTEGEKKDEIKDEGKTVAATSEATAEVDAKDDVEMEAKKPEAPKEVEKPKDPEADAPEDSRPKVTAAAVGLSDSDATLNVILAGNGRVVTSLSEGGFQYLHAGVRSTCGIKSGRYMFEVKILESVSPTEPQGSRGPAPRHLVCVGVSLAGSSLFLADTAESACFDSEGNFAHGMKREKVSQEFSRDHTVALVVNLDAKSPNANTLSLFRDGVRVSEPQIVPESMRGKALYPTITYKNVTLVVNFGPVAVAPLPFTCRMLQDAAKDDLDVRSIVAPADGKYEVVFPVGLPDQGAFDWADAFLEKNPSYTEISDRKVVEWAAKSGIVQARSAGSSRDKADISFGIPLMDDLSVQRVLNTIASTVRRNYVVMELRSNLIADERKSALHRFSSPDFKKVATVIMGEPSSDHKEYVQKAMLADRKSKADASGPIELTQEEKKLWYLKSAIPDLDANAIATSFAKFSLPTKEEGFDEVRYVWQPEDNSAKHLREYVLEKKLTQRVEDLEPSAWFKEEWSKWQKTRKAWLQRKKETDKKKESVEDGGKNAMFISADFIDLSSVEDVMDIGSGVPLFHNFGYEDWILLSTRFEFNLLLHAFRKDLNDPERPSFLESHFPFYYNKYFNKPFDLKQFGVETMAGLAVLIKDTAKLNKETSMLSTVLAEDLPHAGFVKLAEKHRRDRARRFEAGDETAQLKFLRPAPQPPRQQPAPAQAKTPQPKQTQQSRNGASGQRASGAAPVPAQNLKRPHAPTSASTHPPTKQARPS